MQAKKLYDHQEQEKHTAKVGVQEVLPLLPYPYSAQGNQVVSLDEPRSVSGS
jgi:hypothetical protein